MGHVSDFNGMNNCEETDMSQTSSDLFSADNILDFNPNESLLPFSDDTYRQSSLYANNNITSLMHNDDDRNGYFDEPMFDLLFDSDHQFNIDFAAPDSMLGDRASALETDPSNCLEASGKEECGKNNPYVNPIEQEDVKFEKSPTEANSSFESNCDKHVNSDDNSNSEHKTYTAETIFKYSESSDENSQIPKIIIRLKPESKVTEHDVSEPKVIKQEPHEPKVIKQEPQVIKQEPQEPKVIKQEPKELKSFEHELSLADYAAPMTIADNVKLGRRRTLNVKADESESSLSKKNPDVRHRKKSRHKKRSNSSGKIRHSGRDFQNRTSSYNLKKHIKKESTSSIKYDYSPPSAQNDAYHHSEESSPTINKAHLSENNALYSNYQREYNVVTSPVHIELDFNTNGECIDSPAAKSLEFDFADSSILSASSSLDNHKELNDSVEDILEDLEITLGDGGNIPELNKPFLDDVVCVKSVSPSIENSFSCMNGKASQSLGGKEKTDTKPLAIELIDELHAHNQQVFEEIEISTPELELELSDMKNSIQIVCTEASQDVPNCANGGVRKQNGILHGENDTNSQSDLPANKIPSDSSNKTLPSEPLTENTDRSRKISSSSNSFTSKSTSHRSYRKRCRLSSSSSSSSDTEKFYNRPVKYDPVTDSYIDEFGREVRPTELKHHLKSKSIHRDSNNGSSSSTYSRSKSPHNRTRHRKRHRRSRSRSHKKRYYSSSRSRSRSHDRKHKDSSRRYSSKHQSRKPHYMDLEENIKANEERRVMYVGDIPPGFTVEQLKERFSAFGPIQDATIKSKTTSDCSLYIFGFVTFKNRMDACNAIENGNNNPMWPKFDLNFGGRRRFCNGNYTDLDGKVAEYESGWYACYNGPSYRPVPAPKEDDFAELLRLEQKRLGMTK